MAVLLYHGGLSWMRGGFLGVDAFFVLSGYLITTLLIAEWRTKGSIALAEFWARRVRRLAPALLVVLAAVAIYARWWAPADTLHSLRLDGWATLGEVANWRLVLTGKSYFAQAALPSPLLHTWSLAIEEQFYLLWPLAVVAMFRWRRQRTSAGQFDTDSVLVVGIVAALAAVASAVEAVILSGGRPPSARVYYGTDTRAQAVLAGCALAAFLAARRRPNAFPERFSPVSALAGGAGAVVTAAMWIGLSGTSVWLGRGGFTLAAVAAGLVILDVILRPAGGLARGLSIVPLRVLGRLSYALYLWHWPVDVTVTRSRSGLGGVELLILRLAVTLVLAVVSTLTIERPARQSSLRGTRLGVAAASAWCLLGAAMLIGTLPAPTTATAAPSSSPGPATATSGSAASTTAPPPRRAARAPGQPVNVLLEGDSVGLTLDWGISSLASAAGVNLVNKAAEGCGVENDGDYRYYGSAHSPPPQCAAWADRWASDIGAAQPDVMIVILGRWEVVDRKWHGTWTHLGDPGYDTDIESQLDAVVRLAAANGARVALCTAPYYHHGEDAAGNALSEDDPVRVNRFNQLVAAVAAHHPGQVSVIDLGAKLDPAGRFQSRIGGLQVRSSDGTHLTVTAGRWLAPWLLPQLIALGPPINPALP